MDSFQHRQTFGADQQTQEEVDTVSVKQHWGTRELISGLDITILKISPGRWSKMVVPSLVDTIHITFVLLGLCGIL